VTIDLDTVASTIDITLHSRRAGKSRCYCGRKVDVREWWWADERTHMRYSRCLVCGHWRVYSQGPRQPGRRWEAA
jgi:hypothetical protein